MPYVPSAAETALRAVVTALSGLGARVERNLAIDMTMNIPGGGLIVVRDGDPGQPEMTLGNISYHYEHGADVEIFVTNFRTSLDQAFDELRQAVGAALLADRTLGGAVLWANPSAPVAIDLPSATEKPIKAASIPLQLVYVTDNPLN